MWEVCLPASSSSSSPNSRNRQGRLQLWAERASRRSQLVGGGGRVAWEARSRQSKRHPHQSQTGDRHTDADTFSHSESDPCTPPTLQGHPDTLSLSCQSSEHSLDTHGDPGPCPHPTSPHKPCGFQAAAGGWREEGGRQQASERMCSQSPRSWGISCHTAFPKPSKSRQPWSSH